MSLHSTACRKASSSGVRAALLGADDWPIENIMLTGLLAGCLVGWKVGLFSWFVNLVGCYMPSAWLSGWIGYLVGCLAGCSLKHWAEVRSLNLCS
jgi:hypothetical protein